MLRLRSRARSGSFPLVSLLVLTLSALLASCASEGNGGTNDYSQVPAHGGPVGRHGGGARTAQATEPAKVQDAAMTVRPQGIAVDQSGNILIADTPGNQILRIDASGKMTIFAGRGTRGFSGDGGPAVSAELSSPSAVAVDSSGAVFVADSANNVVRKIDAAGIISTFAGNGRNDDWGDGGPATSASLSAPTGLVFDRNGSLVILDSGHGRLRMVDSTGTITAVAAVGRGSSSGMPTNAPTQIPAGP